MISYISMNLQHNLLEIIFKAMHILILYDFAYLVLYFCLNMSPTSTLSARKCRGANIDDLKGSFSATYRQDTFNETV